MEETTWDRDQAARDYLPLAMRRAARAARYRPAMREDIESAAAYGVTRAVLGWDGDESVPLVVRVKRLVWCEIGGFLANSNPRGYGRNSTDPRPEIAALTGPLAATISAAADDRPTRLESDEVLASALRGLDDLARSVIVAVYRDGETLAEYARRSEYSAARASQAHAHALDFLRDSPRALARLRGEPVPEPPPWRDSA